jgi:hypothetical protein
VYEKGPIVGKKSGLFLVYFNKIKPFFRAILILIKMRGYLRPLRDIGFAFLPFLKFFLVLSLLIRYLILVFFLFIFLSKIY